MEAIRKQYTLTVDDQEEIIKRFTNEMLNGLKGEKSTIKMIPSFVTKRPTGDEKGDFLALDLGGTNFRVVLYHLLGDHRNTQDEKKYRIPEEAMTGTAEQLFDFIAKCVLDVNPPDNVPLGFTFSFPCLQFNIKDGELCEWTKGFSTSGCVGKNPTELLNEALKRQGSSIRVAALVNDTVGTLMAKCYEQNNCLVGVILGTGYNCAYVEMANNIPKWKGSKEGEMLINMECGGFGVLDGYRTEEDIELDKLTPNPGAQYNEKMVSGMYLGEICRRLMLKLVKAKELFQSATIDENGHIHSYMEFGTPNLSVIEADGSVDLEDVKKVLEEAGVHNSTLEDRKTVKELANIVSGRSIALAACDITAICRHMGEKSKDCVVGIDGSLYKLYPGYHSRLVKSLVGLKQTCLVELSEDGSGKGAAIIAMSTVH